MLRLTKTTVPVLCFLAVSAIAAGIYLAPSHQEIALMQMDDFNFDTALKNFTAMHSAGNRSINVIAPLINLNIYYGDVDQAIALLESFVAEHPHSIEGHKKLAELYKSTQRFNSYCDMLEELQKLAPSTANLRELADTYNFLGRSQDEMNALARLVDSHGYHSRSEDYLKLASFYRISNQPDEAIRTLRDYIDDQDYDVDMSVVQLAIQLYIDADKDDKAFSLAKSYIKKQGKQEDAVAISSLFEMNNKYEDAYNVLTPYLETMDQFPDLELQVVDLMLAQKKDDEVYTLLTQTRAKGITLSPPLAVALTDLAVTRADFSVLEDLIKNQNLERLPEEALLRYANMSFQLKRPDLAKAIQSKLSKQYLQEAPALGAVLQVAANDTPQSMAALEALPKDAILSPEAKIIIASLYMQHQQAQRAFNLIENVPVGDILTAFDATQYAQLYLDVGAGSKAEPILNAARPTSSPEIQESIDQTLILLAAGQGKADFVKQKLATYAPTDKDFWPDAYDLSLRYNHIELALVIAEQLYKESSTNANRIQLAEALMINHRYIESMGHLSSLVGDNTDARAMFLDDLTAWALQSGGMQNLASSLRKALDVIVDMAVKNPNMELDEKRDIAGVLEDVGAFEPAGNVLLVIAGNNPFNDPDTQELLGFWEDHPVQGNLGWVTRRAKTSPPNEEADWLAYLNDNNHPQVVIDIVQGQGNMSSVVADQFIEALESLQDEKKLASILEELIDSETNTEQLKKYARIASDEDANVAAEKGWRKLLAINPGDNEAAKEIGLIDFDADRLEEAEPLLRQAVQQYDNEYQVNFAYGEILQQEERKSEAKPFLEHALRQISDIPEKDIATQIDEAYLQYETDNITQALALFRRLLNESPDNKDVRAAYVEILVEIGRLDEAQALMQGK